MSVPSDSVELPWRLAPYLRTARPRQWVKNVLVFAAPFGGGVANDPGALVSTAAAFIVFTMASIATYFFNDVMDRDRDKLHPRKASRPIASGLISPAQAVAVALVLLGGSIVLSAIVNTDLVLVVGGYLLLTFTYSVWLKHVPVLDILAVAGGFLLRAVAGGAAADVPLSSWFLLVTSFGALFLVSGKRFAEIGTLGSGGSEHRASLGSYTPEFKQHALTLSAGLAIISYCLWAVEVSGQESRSVLLVLSVVPFVAIFMRYAMLVFSGRGGEPEELLLGDREILSLAGVWVALVGVGFYA